MTGIYIVITGQVPQTFQRSDDLAPVACRQVCTTAGALEQGVAGENVVADEIAYTAGCMTGGFQYGKFQIAYFHSVAFLYPYVSGKRSRTAHVKRAVQSRVCQQSLFFLAGVNGTAVFFFYHFHSADVVVMTVGQ